MNYVKGTWNILILNVNLNTVSIDDCAGRLIVFPHLLDKKVKQLSLLAQHHEGSFANNLASYLFLSLWR